MTDEQLAELEALAEMATKGAWFIVPYGDGDTFVVHSDDEQRIFFPPLLVGYSATAGSLGDPAQIESDMKFIAASRTAIPSLIAEVKRLRAVVADRAAVVEECARRVEAPAVAELVEALGAILADIRVFDCDHLHHTKKDLHKAGPCPVEIRLEAAISRASALRVKYAASPRGGAGRRRIQGL